MKLLRKNVAAGPLSFREKWTKSMTCVVFMNKRFVYRRKLFRLISTFVLIRLRGLTVCLSVSLLDIKQVIFCAEMYVYEFFFSDGFQNGIYRPTPITSGTNDIHMSTMVLYMTEVEEVMFVETPEYTLENYLSDVGGAAGLILGMSAATIVGFIEHILLHLTWRSYQWFGKKSKWFAEKSKVFIHGKIIYNLNIIHAY